MQCRGLPLRRRINRIRNYYKQVAGDQAKLFLLSGHDDGRGVFENAAVPPEGRKQFFTFATVVAVVNSVVGGSAIAIAIGAIADASLGVAAGVGGVAALVSLVALLRYADRLLEERTDAPNRSSLRRGSERSAAERDHVSAQRQLAVARAGPGGVDGHRLPGVEQRRQGIVKRRDPSVVA